MADEIRCAIELRAEGDSPGRLVGTLLVYGERASDRAEVFEPHALTWPAGGVVLRRQHVREAPIMRATPIERDGAVVFDEPIPDTAAGRDAAEEIRSGLFTGLSVEFQASAQRYVASERRISAAVLTGAGLVDSPSFSGSSVELRHGGRRRRAVWL